MKVCIIGTGRSGTKAIYSLVQDLMFENHERVDSIYEPFLWDKNTFNGKFKEVKNAFGSMDSISVEGIYQHQKLPLFIDDPNPFINNEYLADLVQPENKHANILLKFIRANGRISLLHAICPDLKFIFIIRNPLDSVNSIMERFSYFGGEFHHDDFARFIDGINGRYAVNYLQEEIRIPIERELLFWYYMNRFALESFSRNQIPVLKISYETYIERPESCIKQICSFLGYDFKDDYMVKASEKIGDITRTKEIAGCEFRMVLPYLKKYDDLLQEFDMENSLDEEALCGKYLVNPNLPARTRRYYGSTPVQLTRELEAVLKRNAELTHLIKERGTDTLNNG
jgi:hypothetical protein